MKKLSFSTLFFFLFATTIFSQQSDYSGGYGHFFTGPALFTPNDLIDHIQKPEVLGSSFNWDDAAIMTGVEGAAEIHRLIVGGGGFGLLFPNMVADSGEIRFAYGGGHLKVGYVIHQTPKYFLSLSTGFGGGAMYVGMENNSKSTPVYFSSNHPVFPRGTEDYFIGYLMYDLSVGNKFIATSVDPNSNRSGGFMLGLDLGATINVPVGDWYDDDGSISGIPSPGTVISPYLRLTIGGGGFKRHGVPAK